MVVKGHPSVPVRDTYLRVGLGGDAAVVQEPDEVLAEVHPSVVTKNLATGWNFDSDRQVGGVLSSSDSMTSIH